MNANELNETEYLPYFKTYIDQAANLNLIEGLESGLNEMTAFYNSIPEARLEYRYNKGKWTVKEIIGHLLDSERIFCYRALRFARADRTPVLGFNENEYVPKSDSNTREINDLVNDFNILRTSTIKLFDSFNETMLLRKGIAGDGEVSVRALAFLIIGHEKHHQNIIKERYL